jgi:uncharacterized membrane protein YcaP (DUF421 family)
MDINSLLFGNEDSTFLIETGIRTTVMFLVILIGLRLLGKRGIHQLSVFELGVIIGLGSAAGDPMFYKDVGLLPSILVFIIVVTMYRFVTYLISKNDKFETLVEGRARYILRKGRILEAFKNQPIAREELFATLRQNHITHLGQVESAIIEADGQISIFFYPDEEVKHGLPILPRENEDCLRAVKGDGIYACCSCGSTQKFVSSAEFTCKECRHNTCVAATSGPRVR